MDNINYQNIDSFVQIISDIVKETIQTMQNRFEQYHDGVVSKVSSDSSTASVDIGETVLENIPNRSGSTLKNGDAVRIFTTNVTNSDAYIGTKLS